MYGTEVCNQHMYLPKYQGDMGWGMYCNIFNLNEDCVVVFSLSVSILIVTTHDFNFASLFISKVEFNPSIKKAILTSEILEANNSLPYWFRIHTFVIN